MSERVAEEFAEHLIREDGQEDLCLALYSPSTGSTRDTAVLTDVVLPHPGERKVHGNATVTGAYVLRAAALAAERGLGLALLHSHPRGSGWQAMSRPDHDAEKSYAFLAHKLTGFPLVGLTLAGADTAWSARVWTPSGMPRHAEAVRTVGRSLRVTFNDMLRPRPTSHHSQIRTVSAWGEDTQANIARLRVLVVGAGSVGMSVAVHLAATGIEYIGIMDHDHVKEHNLDRLVFARRSDARLHRAKAHVAAREARRASTAKRPQICAHLGDVTEQRWHTVALDYDVIISCVDRPFPRAVLNELAYADHIPVIDGGIILTPRADGTGLSSGTWRTHVVGPELPCMECTGQFQAADVSTDRLGLLENPEYIRGAGIAAPPRQNVALLSASVTASLLALFVSLVAQPGRRGVPGPLRFAITIHQLEHLAAESRPNCLYEAQTGLGDQRIPLTRDLASRQNHAEGGGRRHDRTGNAVFAWFFATVRRRGAAVK
jgi:hypothetical protein